MFQLPTLMGFSLQGFSPAFWRRNGFPNLFRSYTFQVNPFSAYLWCSSGFRFKKPAVPFAPRLFLKAKKGLCLLEFPRLSGRLSVGI
jgi:hypothetical protein